MTVLNNVNTISRVLKYIIIIKALKDVNYDIIMVDNSRMRIIRCIFLVYAFRSTIM